VPRKLHKIREISRIKRNINILQQNIIQIVGENSDFLKKPSHNTENPRVGGSIPPLGIFLFKELQDISPDLKIL
jgi:hypothetical protein